MFACLQALLIWSPIFLVIDVSSTKLADLLSLTRLRLFGYVKLLESSSDVIACNGEVLIGTLI